MLLENKINKTEISCIVSGLQKNGYSLVNPKFYYNFDNKENLDSLQKSYSSLKKDPSPGNRYRAYTRYLWCPNIKKITEDDKNDYFQSEEYNPLDGGKTRNFNKIKKSFLYNEIIEELISKDIEIAKLSSEVNFSEKIIIGLHQIRYVAKLSNPSYSSPPWLHRDDESLVFVHLFNLTDNAIGGDNLISYENQHIDNVIRLTQPLETLSVNKLGLHAVTPLGSINEAPAFRDILLVTFHNQSK